MSAEPRLAWIKAAWRLRPPSSGWSVAAIGAVVGAAALILGGTWWGAAEGLKLQLERQLSRDLNVVEAWHGARSEELQLTAVGLVRHPELPLALQGGPTAPAVALIAAEGRRLRLGLALLLDPNRRPVGAMRERVEAHGLPASASRRREPVVGILPFDAREWPGWQGPMPEGGLVRAVATPLGAGGVLLLAESLAPGSGFPERLVGMMGGSVAVTGLRQVAGAAGFPAAWDASVALGPEIWAGVQEGRYFFAEAGPIPYLLAFRPIFDHEGRPVGAFVRGFPESIIGESLWRSAGTVAAAAAAALALALLGLSLALRLTLLEARGHARQRWIGKVIEAQEEERRRVALELHDQTGQSLTGLMVALKAMEAGPDAVPLASRLAAMRGMVGQALEEVRRLSLALRPPILDELGLSAALSSLATQQAQAMGWRLELRLPGPPKAGQAEALDHALALTAYRIAQEAITNVARHACASRLALSLVVEGAHLHLLVEDDGLGFDLAEAQASGRLGLVGMAERAALVGGTLQLESAPGQGSRVRFDAPLSSPHDLEPDDA
jgi:signal transduction histidine kinase